MRRAIAPPQETSWASERLGGAWLGAGKNCLLHLSSSHFLPTGKPGEPRFLTTQVRTTGK